jgi:hypothetical protein
MNSRLMLSSGKEALMHVCSFAVSLLMLTSYACFFLLNSHGAPD